jgi:hypothetical protein
VQDELKLNAGFSAATAAPAYPDEEAGASSAAPGEERQMDKVAVGAMIAIAALAMNGWLMRDVLAAEAPRQPPIAAPTGVAAPEGGRAERVLGLLVTLSALHAAPAALAGPKV